MGRQNLKTGPDAIDTIEKLVWTRKTWKRDMTPSVPPKTSLGAQYMKTGHDTLATFENEFGHAKYEKGTWRPQYGRKGVQERKTWKQDPTHSTPPKTIPGAQNMKTGSDALGTVENESGRANHKIWTRRPWYRRKWVREGKTCKRDPTHSVPPKMSPGVQNMKTGPDAVGTVENEFEHAKIWKQDPTPVVPPKTTPRAQVMKTAPDALGTVENESGRAKYENGTRCPRYHRNRVGREKHENGTRHSRYRRKWVRARKAWKMDQTPLVPSKISLRANNMNTVPDAIDTIENMSGRAKHENETWRPRYRRKWVRERKTWKRDTTPSLPSKMSLGTQNMKTGPDALGTIENDSGSAKHENGTRRPRYRRKRFLARKTWKRDQTPSVPSKMSPGAQKLKKGGRPWYCRKWVQAHKTWKRDPTPSVPSKMTPGAQNMKTWSDALGTAENESGWAKHENGT
jgi:hypothetical protein